METKGVTETILSSVRIGVVNQLSGIAKRPFNGANIQILEKGFYNTIGQSGVNGLGYLFSCNDESERIIIHNGKRHYRKYFSSGRYITLLGEIIIKRGIFQANQTKHSICPLELKLKFINDYVSFAATEYICYSMASMTLGEFVKHCQKWSLMKPSEGTVKRVLDYVGNFLETTDFLDRVRSKEQMPEKAVTLAMSIDSTCVNIRQEGWRHATAATISTYDDKGNRLGTVYIGRMPEKRKIKVKRMLAKEVKDRLEKHEFKYIVCIADGARDLWLYFKRKYPHAIHVVDFFHVCEHLSKLSELLFEDPLKAQVWYKKYRTILKEDIKGAEKLLRAARYRRSLIKKTPEVDAEIKYLQRNRRRMNYHYLQENNLPIGSGVVEAACKNLIGSRMKKSGMRWTINGGQTILTLRSLILSDRWESFWSYFLKQHFSDFQT